MDLDGLQEQRMLPMEIGKERRIIEVVPEPFPLPLPKEAPREKPVPEREPIPV